MGPGSCASCAIELTAITTLGERGGGDGALSSRPHAIARDSRERYYVLASQDFPEPPFVYDQTGTFLQRIGVVGEGPNEYGMPAELMVGASDSIRVIDLMNARTGVLGADYVEARTYPIVGFIWDATLLPDGRSIVNAQIETLERAGLALHILDPNGEIADSFDEYPRTGGQIARFARYVQLAPDSLTLWSVSYAHEYRLAEWTLEGVPIRDIEPFSTWFVPYADISYPTPDSPPSPYAVGIWEDPSDPSVVWVIGEMADRDWARGLSGPQSTGDESFYVRETYHEVHDGFIEAVDLNTGEILASARTDRPFLNVVEPGLVAVASEDAAGFWYAHLYRVSLSR